MMIEISGEGEVLKALYSGLYWGLGFSRIKQEAWSFFRTLTESHNYIYHSFVQVFGVPRMRG